MSPTSPMISEAGAHAQMCFTEAMPRHAACNCPKVAVMLPHWVGRTITAVNEEHPQKANIPMAATESGMVMLANELHLAKANIPMAVTEPGMATLANELQPWKASFPMVVTESGIRMLANELQ